MTKLEQEFTRTLLEHLAAAEALTGIPEKRLSGRAEERGGPAAVKEYLNRGQVSRQFDALKKLGRLDLSAEYLPTLGRFSPLFTDEETNLCLSALLEAGAFDHITG